MCSRGPAAASRLRAPPRGLIALGLAIWSTASIAWLLPGRSGLFAALDLQAFIDAGGLGGWPVARLFPLILVAWFLTSMALAWLVLRVGAGLDREGRVVEALAWPLRSRAFVMAGWSWMLVVGAILLVARPDPDGWAGLILLVTPVLAVLLLPFVAWRPRLLDAPRPSPILGLHWPGWRAVFVVGGCALLGVLSSMVDWWLEHLLPGLVLLVLDEVLSAALLVLMLLAWFNDGRLASIMADLRRLPLGRVMVELLAFAWLVGTVTLLVGMPLLAAGVHAVYVVPELSRSGGSLSWSSTAAVWLVREGQGMSLLAALPLAWYLALVEGRWARGHGIGRGTIAEQGG